MEKGCFGSGVITSDRAKIGGKDKEKSDMRGIELFILICFCHFLTGFLSILWFPGEVASPLIIVGGSSAIYFLFLAKCNEERSLSLLIFLVNNLSIYYVLNEPDLLILLVSLFFIILSFFHLFLFVGYEKMLDSIFYAVLLSRMVFHPKMGEWGFGLVTELMFLRLLSIFLKKEYRSGEGSRIEPLFYLIPIFCIAFFYQIYLSIQPILIHINFLFAGASLIYF